MLKTLSNFFRAVTVEMDKASAKLDVIIEKEEIKLAESARRRCRHAIPLGHFLSFGETKRRS